MTDPTLAERLARCVRVQLFLDCDGVLADFDAAFKAAFGHEPRDYESSRGSSVFWRDIRNDAPEFYRNLPLMPDARELFDAVKHLRPIILTGCPMGGWAEAQKIAWAAEHFPGTPMITCMSRDKRVFCQPGDILVDDLLRYRDRWIEAGGVFVHHTSAKSTLAALDMDALAQEVEAERDEARLEAYDRRHMNAPEDPHVEALCVRYGYGAVMDAASRLWARRDSLGAFYIGGCIGLRGDAEAAAILRALAKREEG
jgi:5'(3')-deoxyribonucleotidase